MRRLCLLPLLLASATVFAAELPWRQSARAENHEEPGGVHVGIMGGDGVGGLSAGSGTWLENTWVLGDYEAGMFYSDDEGVMYGSLGMTLRVMPRWSFAPFVGAGGAYNQTFGSQITQIENGKEITRGESHFAGIVEAGFRAHYGEGKFLDLSARQVWPDVDAEDAEYFAVRVAFGKQ